MIAARAQFLGGGHYGILAEAVVERARALAPEGLFWRLARERLTTCRGLSSKCRSVPGSLSISRSMRPVGRQKRTPAWEPSWGERFPVAGEASRLTLDVFAPRQPAELHRTLHRNGRLVVVTPRSHHMCELRDAFALLRVDPCKERRIEQGFRAYFRLCEQETLEWQMHLTKADVGALVAMGPSARHLEPLQLLGASRDSLIGQSLRPR